VQNAQDSTRLSMQFRYLGGARPLCRVRERCNLGTSVTFPLPTAMPEERQKSVDKVLAKHYTMWCNVGMDQLTDVLTAISHPTRRAIIGRLASGPAGFLEIAKPFDTALNAVTKHLKLLERAGLIERKKQGRQVLISFRVEPLRLVSGWVHEYERFWDERLDQFEQYFKNKKEKKEKKK
jgi:DNA-binding transcriptional ArsR family regulator